MLESLSRSIASRLCSGSCSSALTVLLALILGASVGCAPGDPSPGEQAQEQAAETALERARERGTLTVLSFPHQESVFVRTNLEMGPTPELGPGDRFIGVDIDLMSGFAEQLGAQLEVRRVSKPEYGALIPDLLEGKADLIASSFTVTSERQEQVLFSDPYFSVYPVIVTRADSAVQAVEDLEGLIPAAISGSSHEEHLLRLGVSSETMAHMSFTQQCFSSVSDGSVDYTLHDSNSSLRYLRSAPELKIAFRLPGEDSYGFAARFEDRPLIEELNRYLAKVEQSGELQEIIERHVPGMAGLSPDQAGGATEGQS